MGDISQSIDALTDAILSGQQTTWKDYVYLISALISVIAVIISWISINYTRLTLKEMQVQRDTAYKPDLFFFPTFYQYRKDRWYYLTEVDDEDGVLVPVEVDEGIFTYIQNLGLGIGKNGCLSSGLNAEKLISKMIEAIRNNKLRTTHNEYSSMKPSSWAFFVPPGKRQKISLDMDIIDQATRIIDYVERNKESVQGQVYKMWYWTNGRIDCTDIQGKLVSKEIYISVTIIVKCLEEMNIQIRCSMDEKKEKNYKKKAILEYEEI